MLKDTLNELFQQTERLWPDARRFLLPGMSEEEIAGLEEENNITLSQPVKELLKTTAGSVGTDEEGNEVPFLFPVFGTYRLMGLEEAIEMRWDFLRGNFFDEYTDNWFPLFEDNYEFWLLVDVSSDEGAVLEYAAEYWEGYERRTMFPSLEAMFAYISELFKNGCYTLDDDDRLKEDDALALETAVAMFDLPYWKERADEAAEHEQQRKWMEKGGAEQEQAMALRALVQQSRALLEDRLRGNR